MVDGDDTGLRERKKVATRNALCRAAIHLALQEGPENVRVPDVAAAAGVSPRTYNNYFSSIPEAICAIAADRVMELGNAVRGRPVDEPLAKAVASAILATDPSIGGDKEIVRMVIKTPALSNEMFKTFAAREIDLGRAIAERVNGSPDDLFPQVLAAAYGSTIRVVTRRWLSAEDEMTQYLPMLRDALALIAPMAWAYEVAATRRNEGSLAC